MPEVGANVAPQDSWHQVKLKMVVICFMQLFVV